jgi:hypothetical protein
MGTLIDDTVLEAFAVVGEPQQIVPEMKRRYGAFVDRTSATFPFADADMRIQMIAQLKAA